MVVDPDQAAGHIRLESPERGSLSGSNAANTVAKVSAFIRSSRDFESKKYTRVNVNVGSVGSAFSRRNVAFIGLAAAAAAVLKYSRVVPVSTFLLFAAVRMLLGTSARSNPAARANEWDGISPPEVGRRSAQSRVAITHHPWYSYHGARQANTCLALAADAGVGYLRSDVRWKDILPDAVTVSNESLRWYRSYFTAVRSWYEMKPIIVLSNAPRMLRSLSENDQILAWNRYAELVANTFGDLCSTFQILNEPNNPVWRFIPRSRTSEAICSAAHIIKARVPHSAVCINILMTLPNWRSTLHDLLVNDGGAIDIIGLDHYPGTWSVTHSDWSALLDLAQEMNQAREGTFLHGRRLAIMETGYSTNLKRFRTEYDQAVYIKDLVRVTRLADKRLAPGSLDFVGVYEMSDEDSTAIVDPEAHFGVLTSDLRPKHGLAALQSLCKSI